MDDISRYAVGLDVGTENVRAVVASISQSGKISVVGYNEGKKYWHAQRRSREFVGPF